MRRAGWVSGGVMIAGIGAALLTDPAVSAAEAGPDAHVVSPASQSLSTTARPAHTAAGPARRPGAGPRAAAATAAKPAAAPRSNQPAAGRRGTAAKIITPPAAIRAAGSPPPVNVDDYLGKWYEQGSVKLPFEWGMVNITASYSRKRDGAIRVLNSGRLFGPNGLPINVVGNAVPVNSANNRLAVNFFINVIRGEPGNYWILDHAPDYNWSIVSDPTHFTGWILTRNATLPEGQYQDLVKQARALGVWGPITKTKQQYPVV